MRRPATPTRGRKRVAIGTLALARRLALSTSEGHPDLDCPQQVMTSMTTLETRLNGKLARLVVVEEGLEARLNERLKVMRSG